MAVQSMTDFWGACESKMRRKAEEHGRSMEPWKEFDLPFLLDRIEEEIEEAKAAIDTDDWEENLADELTDIANFCAFIWLRLKEEKDGDIA